MTIRLTINDPLDVSSGEEPDYVYIQISMDEYKDINGRALPASIVKYYQMPR